MHQRYGRGAGSPCIGAEIKRDPASDARDERRLTERPKWPMIVFRTPKGWTCPAVIDGKKCGGLLAVAPGADGRDDTRHARAYGPSWKGG